MARGARLTRANAVRLAALAGAIAGGQGAHGASSDPSVFLGVWTFAGGSEVQAECVGVGTVLEALGGTRASIYRGTTTDIVFDIGCHCALGLQVDGDRATLAGTQPCTVVARGQQISGDITALTIDRAQDGTLSIALSGEHARVVSTVAGCELTGLTGSGALERTGDGAIGCGAPETAVGVLSATPNGVADCLIGAGREGLRISLEDENDPPCTDGTSTNGEGRWLLPDDKRPHTPICNPMVHTTVLYFCRVDGAQLRPMTTAEDPSQYYAVLKLGTTCPNGSFEVRKTIDNEDAPLDPSRSGAIGDLGPNQVLGDPAVGTITKLNFCFFRNAATIDGVMAGFPDFGVPYAVFHRHVGEQPPWVLMRRQQFSNDEDSQSGINRYDTATPAVIPEFEELIENPQLNTVYNYARVR